MSVPVKQIRPAGRFPSRLKEMLVLALVFGALWWFLGTAYALSLSLSSLFGSLGAGIVLLTAAFWFSRELTMYMLGETQGLRDHLPRHGIDLLGMVEEVSKDLGMPMPTVVMHGGLNKYAFTTGRNPHHALIVVSEGCLKAFKHNHQALKAVIMHEMGHVRHRHMFSLIAYRILTSFINLLSLRWLIRQESQVQRRRKSMTSFLMDIFGINLLFSFLGLIGLSLQRSYEFEADKFATQQGHGVALIQALTILDDESGYGKAFKDSTYESLVDAGLIEYVRPTPITSAKTWQGRVRAWMESFSTTNTSAQSTFLFSRFLDGVMLHGLTWLSSWTYTHPDYDERVKAILDTMELEPQKVARRDPKYVPEKLLDLEPAAPALYTPHFCRTGCDLDPQKQSSNNLQEKRFMCSL